MLASSPKSSTLADVGVLYRPIVASDEGFIVSSWLRSYRDRASGARWARELEYSRYWAEDGFKGACVMALRRTGGIVAADAEDPDTILGWAAGNIEAVHYVYVKSAFRRHGIAHRLLREIGAGDACSCLTDVGRALWPRARCNPILVYA